MSFSKLDMNISAPFWHSGPTPGSVYNFPSVSKSNDIAVHSQTPITTGTSVVAVKFAEGVILAADMLGSYGSLARFRNCSRVMKVNDNIVLGAGGDYGDYQYLKSIIEQKIIDEECLDDGFRLKPRALHCWLTRVLYNRRSRLDPLWNDFVIAGLEDGKPFIGTVDKLGTAYTDNAVATGFGSYLAIPILRDVLDKAGGVPLTQKVAQTTIERCMEVLFYRDARSFPKYEIAILTKDGVTIKEAKVNQNWQFAHTIKGY